MTEQRPLPKAWKGNERAVLLLLQARLLTLRNDLHTEELVDLWMRCWSVRTFPPSDAFRQSDCEIRRRISLQLEIPLPRHHQERLREIASLVRAASTHRAEIPGKG